MLCLRTKPGFAAFSGLFTFFVTVSAVKNLSVGHHRERYESTASDMSSLPPPLAEHADPHRAPVEQKTSPLAAKVEPSKYFDDLKSLITHWQRIAKTHFRNDQWEPFSFRYSRLRCMHLRMLHFILKYVHLVVILSLLLRLQNRKSNLFTVLYSLYYGTPKRVTSIRGFSPRHCAWATQLLKKCRSGGDNMSDLTGWRGLNLRFSAPEKNTLPLNLLHRRPDLTFPKLSFFLKAYVLCTFALYFRPSAYSSSSKKHIVGRLR